MKPFILDLDHCLIYTSFSELSNVDLISQKGYYYLYHRPDLNIFLKFLIKKKYDLVFYTSSKKEYARWVVKSFNLEKDYPIYTRYYTDRKRTNYGDIYKKSLDKINISSRRKIPVLDDRTDLWDENGVSLISIEPWYGDVNDRSLSSIMIKSLKER